MAKESRRAGESKTDYLLRTKYAGKKSATEVAREKEERRARRKNTTLPKADHRRNTSVSEPQKASGSQARDGQSIEEWYEQHRQTPTSRGRRQRHRQGIPSDAESGGGEAFADRSARSGTKWSWFGR